MKALAWIRKSIKKSITWMWIGSIIIFISVVLQMVALYYPSHTLTLAMIGLSVNAISVPVTVALAYMSAREFEQERRTREAAEQRVWNDTPSGRQHAALSQLRTEMHMDSQEETPPGPR